MTRLTFLNLKHITVLWLYVKQHTIVVDLFHLENACFDFNPQLLHEVVGVNSCQ